MWNLRKLPVALALEAVAIYFGLEQLGIEVPSFALPTWFVWGLREPTEQQQEWTIHKAPAYGGSRRQGVQSSQLDHDVQTDLQDIQSFAEQHHQSAALANQKVPTASAVQQQGEISQSKIHGRPGLAEGPAKVVDVNGQVQEASCILDTRPGPGFDCRISGRAHKGDVAYDPDFEDHSLPAQYRWEWEDCLKACEDKERPLKIKGGQISCCSFNRFNMVRHCNLYVSPTHVRRKQVQDRDMEERRQIDSNHVLNAQEIKHKGLSSPGHRGHGVSSSGSIRQKEEKRKADEKEELAKIAKKEREHAEKRRKRQSNLNTKSKMSDTDAEELARIEKKERERAEKRRKQQSNLNTKNRMSDTDAYNSI